MRDFERLVHNLGFALLSSTGEHAIRAGSFPAEHRDPCDRFLAAQAQVKGLVLLSFDTRLDQFGIHRSW